MEQQNAYIFIVPGDLDKTLYYAISQDNAGELRSVSQPLEQAFCDLKNWAGQVTGNVVLGFGNVLGLEIPIDRVSEVSDVVDKYKRTSGVDFWVGVATTPLEAQKALDKAGPEHKLVVYSDDDSESSFEWDEVEKAEVGEPKYNLDFPNLELEGDPQKPTMISSKMPNQVSYKDRPAQGELHHLEHGQVKAKQDIKMPIPPRQKIIEALMQIKQHAPNIARLKELNPKSYDAIKKLIDAMILLAEGHARDKED